MTSSRVLCVDDEADVLAAFRRTLRKQVTLDCASSGAEALAHLERHGAYAVVLSDMRMPVMDGITLLQKVRERWPLTVRMMLTGNNDVETAMVAVNEGSVFRFLTKPCPSERLLSNIQAGIEQYRLLTAEKELLEKTLAGSVRLLTELMESMDLGAGGSEARQLARSLGQRFGLQPLWPLELAAMLGRIGLLTMPPKIIEKVREGGRLFGEELELFCQIPGISSQLLKHIPRLDEVAKLIAQTAEENEEPGLAARILRIVFALLDLEARGYQRSIAIQLLQRDPQRYDPTILEMLTSDAELPQESGRQRAFDIREVPVAGLRSGMIVMAPLTTRDGRSLVGPGRTLSPALVQRIQNFHALVGILEPIRVRVPSKESAGD